MEYFNKEQLEQLQEAEQYFSTVVYSQYKMPSPVSLNEKVIKIYEEATGKTLTKQMNCPKCLYNNFKIVGELYFKSKEYWETNTPVPETLTTQTVTEVIVDTTKEKRLKALEKAREAKKLKAQQAQ